MRLSFKAVYIEPILSGQKTTTIRGRRYGIQEGDTVEAICRYNKPPFAELVVTRVETVPIEQAEQAWPDIRATYPGRSEVFVFHFRRAAI